MLIKCTAVVSMQPIIINLDHVHAILPGPDSYTTFVLQGQTDASPSVTVLESFDLISSMFKCAQDVPYLDAVMMTTLQKEEAP
jgi:hypothetical protein